MTAPVAKQSFHDGLIKVYPCRDRKRTTYTLSWYVRKERNRRTFSSWTEAEKEIERIAANITLGNLDVSTISTRDLHYFRLCEERLGGIPLDRAVQFFLDQHQLQPSGKTVAEVVTQFLKKQNEDKNISDRQKETVKHHLLGFAQEITAPIASVHAQDIDAYLRKNRWAQRTRLNHRISLLSLFGYARRKGYLPRHTDTEASLSDPIRVRTKTPEIWSVGEFESLLRSSGNCPALPVLVLGGLAGVRTAECARLTWGNLHRDTGTIRLERNITKTRSSRLAPFLPCAQEWLEDPDPDPRVRVFDSFGTPRRPHSAVKEVSTRCNLAWRPNALRHSFATYYLALTGDPAKVSLATGHSVSVLLSTYKVISIGGQPITKTMAEDYFAITP
ncbi:MAG: site-specific integrase [Luteolibacter sp.]